MEVESGVRVVDAPVFVKLGRPGNGCFCFLVIMHNSNTGFMSRSTLCVQTLVEVPGMIPVCKFFIRMRASEDLGCLVA